MEQDDVKLLAVPNLCKLCNKVFASPTALEVHNRKHNDVWPYACSNCHFRFRQKVHLQRHIITAHTKDDSQKTTGNVLDKSKTGFSCQKCLQVFTDEKALITHASLHNVSSISCTDCHKIFNQIDALAQHIVNFHWKSDNTCIKCDRKFIQPNAIQRHLRLLRCPVFRKELTGGMESNHHQLVCEHCSLSFPGKKALELHVRKHTGEKPYTCVQCGTSFSLNGNLKAHISSVHEGIKKHIVKKSPRPSRFVCNLCEKSFISAVDLRSHKRVHTGDQPFVCQHCERNFSQKGNLNKHIQRWHSTKKKDKLNQLNPATFKIKRQKENTIKIEPRRNCNTPPDNSYIYVKFKQSELSADNPNQDHSEIENSCFTVNDNNVECENHLPGAVVYSSVIPSTLHTLNTDLTTDFSTNYAETTDTNLLTDVSQFPNMDIIASGINDFSSTNQMTVCNENCNDHNYFSKDDFYQLPTNSIENTTEEEVVSLDETLFFTPEQVKTFNFNELFQNMFEHPLPSTLKVSPSKTYVIVNNVTTTHESPHSSIDIPTSFQETTSLETPVKNVQTILETPKKLQSISSGDLEEGDGNQLNDVPQIDLNWLPHIFQTASQISRQVSSASVTVIKNVCGGEVKDIPSGQKPVQSSQNNLRTTFGQTLF